MNTTQTSTMTERYALAIARLEDANCQETALRVAIAHHDCRTWIADDGNAKAEYECEERDEAAREYVDDGCWGDELAPAWVEVCVYPRYYVGGSYMDDTDDCEYHTV